VSNAEIVQVDWASGGAFADYVTNGQMEAYYAGITNSRYFDLLYEYRNEYLQAADGLPHAQQVIGRGTFGGRYEITPSVTANPITDAQIQAELVAQIATGALPAPTADRAGNTETIYVIHFPQGITIDLGTDQSCTAFCAYHGTIQQAQSDGGAQEYLYAVMPDFSPGSGCEVCVRNVTPFQQATVIASHELAETVTDPEVGLAPPVSHPADGGERGARGHVGQRGGEPAGADVGASLLVVERERSGPAGAKVRQVEGLACAAVAGWCSL
jgi:hypothetical protein